MSTALILFLILVFAIYYLRSSDHPKKADPKPRQIVASLADGEWRSKFHANCESPAEVAFVNALIDDFGLTPRHGALFSDALRLDLQVEQDHYRADFMANGWLIIEVDGAAWHGSDEAKARDAKRDLYFESLGYSVLRIAAKTALSNPSEAVRVVRAALAVGKRTMVGTPRKSSSERLAEIGSLTLNSISAINDRTSRLVTVQRALTDAQSVFELEQKVIQQAINAAESRLRTEAYLDTNEKRQSFDNFASKLNQRLNELEAADATARGSVVVPPFPANIAATGLHADEISRKFKAIQEDRRKFFYAVQRKLEGSIELEKVVVENLQQLGCATLALMVVRASAHDGIEH